MTEQSVAPPADGLGLPHSLRRTLSAQNESLVPEQSPSQLSSSPDIDEVQKQGDNSNLRSTDRLDFLHQCTLIVLALAYVGSLISGFFTGPSINAMAKDLHLGRERSWISTSGGVATAAIVPCIGYLQDLIGRRSLFAVGLALALASSVIIATSQSFAQLIVGHVLNSIGSGIQELSATAAIAEFVPARLRGLYFGLTLALTLLFTPAVLYVDLLSEYATWRWLFWINLMWNGIVTGLLAVTYFPMKQIRHAPRATLSSIKQFDFVGVILFVGGIIEILIALQAGGIVHPWASAYILVQLLVGILLIVLFVIWESREYGRPLVPVRLFRGQRVVGLVFLICFFSGMPYTTYLSLGPTIITEVFRMTGIRTGLIALPGSISLAIGAALSNIMITVTKGRTREVLVVTAAAMTIFNGADAIIAPGRQALWATLGAIAALGVGGTLITLSTVVTLACPQDLIGTAIALTITLRTIGGTVGYAILYNIYVSQAEEGARNPTQGARLVYLVTMAFCAVPLVLSACLPNMKSYMKERALTRLSTKSFGA